MKKTANWLIASLISILMLGCGTPPPRLATPSGKPEILISGVTRKQVADAIVSDRLSSGFQVKSVNDYTLVVVKDINDFAAQVVYGTKFNRVPETRITHSFAETGSGIRVYIRSEIVSNPNSQYESLTDFTESWGGPAQDYLNRLKNALEKN